MRNEPDGRPNYVLGALAAFAEYGDHEALVGGGQRWDFAGLRTAVLDLAALLWQHGVRGGQTVAVIVSQPVEGPILQLALHLIGCRTAWVALVNTPRRETDEMLRRVEPDVVVYDARLPEPLARELSLGLGVPVLCLGPDGAGPDLLVSRPAALADFDLALAGTEPDAVFQTSGSTGLPKLIRHSQDLYDQVHELAQGLIAAGEPRYRHLTITPMSHISGQMAAFLYLFAGSTLLIFTDLFDAGEYLALMERERVDSTFVGPTLLQRLLDHPTIDEVDLSAMVMLSIGGAATTPDRLRAARARFGDAVRVTYGLSESPFVSAYSNIADDPSHPDRIKSCGQAYGDVRVQIRGEDDAVLGTGEVGELWVASKLNFAEYHTAPELTEKTLVDGWLRTGDVGYLDEDGYLHLVGRSTDLIVTGAGARNIYPRPIEDALSTHPKVRAAAVIAVPDDMFGEAVHAYVVPTQDGAVTEEELSNWVAAELTPMWAPRSIDFVEELPLLGIGKVDKKSLRDRYATEHLAATIGAAR